MALTPNTYDITKCKKQPTVNDGFQAHRQSHHVHFNAGSLEPDKMGNERRDRVNCTRIPEAVGWFLVIGVKYSNNGSGAA